MMRRETPKSAREYEDVEVHQETDGQPSKPQVGHDLRLMDRKQPLNGFEFDEYAILDDNVEAVAAVDEHLLVLDWERALTNEP